MSNAENAFINFAIEAELLKFGDYKLKSGRRSPYFMDANVFFAGSRLLKIGDFYADAISKINLEFDVLFGPAYKGIPLASAAASVLADRAGCEMPCIFDRKEAKDHAEGGVLMGQYKKGSRCLIIDDVLTSGTAARHSMKLLRDAGIEPVGLLVLMDRQEHSKHDDNISAADSLRTDGFEVHSVSNMSSMLDWMKAEVKKDIEKRKKYDAKSKKAATTERNKMLAAFDSVSEYANANMVTAPA